MLQVTEAFRSMGVTHKNVTDGHCLLGVESSIRQLIKVSAPPGPCGSYLHFENGETEAQSG